MTLQQLTAEAYAVVADFIKCPDYFLEDHFDITAKLPAGSRKEDAAPMLQSLLADRFKLAVHWEHQEEPVVRSWWAAMGRSWSPSVPTCHSHGRRSAQRSQHGERKPTEN